MVVNLVYLFSVKLFLGFSEPASSIMEGVIDFHNYIFFFLVLIFSFVFLILCNILIYFWLFFELPKNNWEIFWRWSIYENNNVIHGTVLEVIWTMVPGLVLITIAFPSFTLLYTMDEVMIPGLTLKVVGHQWYWSYEYSDLIDYSEFSDYDLEIPNLDFDSYMIPESELGEGDLRLLEVTKALVLPINVYVRVLVSSVDVLHSFSINNLGIKADAVPGRLNQLSLNVKHVGVFYGQCSELCGVSHGMMPIVLKAVESMDFAKWVLYLSKE